MPAGVYKCVSTGGRSTAAAVNTVKYFPQYLSLQESYLVSLTRVTKQVFSFCFMRELYVSKKWSFNIERLPEASLALHRVGESGEAAGTVR